MDLSLVGPGETSVKKSSFKVPAHEVIDLTSDDESVLEDPQTVALAEAHNSELPSDGEIEDEPSESLSWLEDILEEVGDEQLFDGGKPQCGCP